MRQTQTRHTFCRICEATCGLSVDVDVAQNRIVDIRPDPDHVVSRGYACVKGTRYASLQHSPDRVLHPQKRVGRDRHDVSWDEALREIAAVIRRERARRGPQAIGHFVGSAGGANVLAPLFRGALWKAIGSKRMYGTGTCDTMNKFRVNEDMYGSPMRLAHPDVDRTSFLMVLGANPVVSGNTLYHLPRARERFAGIVERGGRVVFVNPRRVESAQVGEHVFIRPDTDLFFLAAFCREIIAGGAVDRGRVDRFTSGFDVLERAVGPWTPERQAQVTGVAAATLRELVRAHAAADGAALYMATGVNQGRSGTLCFWLLECINAISGNLDRAGGTLMGRGLFDMAKEVTRDPQMMTSHDRDDGLPTVAGQQPAGMLADDILSGRVSVLVVEASNPILACSSPGGRLEEALRKLELLVSIDLFRNEVGSLAHWVLPATTWMERPEIPYALQSFAGCTPTPYMIYADPVLAPPPDVRHEWWIYTRLADELGVTLFGNRLASGAAKAAARLSAAPLGGWIDVPGLLIGGMLKKGGLPGRKAMAREHPHGILLPEHRGGDFLGTDRVLTPDRRVALAPPDIVRQMDASAEALWADELRNADRVKLVGKREMRRMNTSSANCAELVSDETNYAYVSREDAVRIGIADGELVEVESAHGCIRIPARVTDDMMPRTIAIPQCWGHARAEGLGHARSHPGVNSNVLAGDGPGHIERLSGMSHLSGILVDLRRAPAGAEPGEVAKPEKGRAAA
ncbi:MAG TPA: molybdopterin-dependent oxidoreductase [Candidatus Binatia bacterium]|nr:molybdopterin-dependent oxidoreductase [Candidatus Binatia bacterium]